MNGEAPRETANGNAMPMRCGGSILYESYNHAAYRRCRTVYTGSTAQRQYRSCTTTRPPCGATVRTPKGQRPTELAAHRLGNRATAPPLTPTHRVRDHIGPHTRAHERRGRRPRPLESGDATTSTTRAQPGAHPGASGARRPWSHRGAGTGCDIVSARCQLCSDVRARAHFNTHFCRDCGLV